MNKLSNVRSFSILQSRGRGGGGGGGGVEGSTSLSNDNSANFSGEKKYNEELRGSSYFLTVREKT